MSAVGSVGEPPRVPDEPVEPEAAAPPPAPPGSGPLGRGPLFTPVGRGAAGAGSGPRALDLQGSMLAHSLGLVTPAGGPLKPGELEARSAEIRSMADDLDRLEKAMKDAENGIDLRPYVGTGPDGRRIQITGDPILKFKWKEEKVADLKHFLLDFSKLVGFLATGRAADIVSQKGLEGAWKEVTGYSFEKYEKNLTPLLAPWRSNGNDWFTDFFGHPALGFGLGSYFRDQGYSKLTSFVGAVLADCVWEFGLEGAEAPPEWNDFLTTSVIGAAIGAFLNDAKVGGFAFRPMAEFDPSTKRVAMGVKVTHDLGAGKSVGLSVARTPSGLLSAGAELKLGNRVSIFGTAEGLGKDKDARKFGGGFTIHF